MIVPTRRAADGSRVLALPKGHVDPGETPIRRPRARCARRPASSPSRCASWARSATGTAATGRTIGKAVAFFLFNYVEGDIADHDDEVEEARWMALEEARTELSYEAEREMVDARAGLPRQRPIACSGLRARAQRSVTSSGLRKNRSPLRQRIPMQVLNFYSTIFADELKRGRKTATIRARRQVRQVPQEPGRAGHDRLPVLAARKDLRSGHRPGRGDEAVATSPRGTSSTTTPSSAATRS